MLSFGGKNTLGMAQDGLLIKVDSSGNTAWVLSAGGPGSDQLMDAASDGKGNLLLAGNCQDWATFGSHTLKVSPYNVDDMCVAKLRVAP